MPFPSDPEIQARFNELPREVQEAIQSADMAHALQEVGTAYGLHVDQLGALEDETLLVMLGFGNPVAFPERIRDMLQLQPERAHAVAEDISQKLFVPIRASMRQYMERKLHSTATPSASVMPSAIRQEQTTTAPATSVPAAPTVTPAAGGGKTIMPTTINPVLHPADRALATPSVTMPTIKDFSAPGALATPATTAAKQYVADPYREPVV